MWPFDDPQSQIPANVNVPKLGPASLADPKDLKILELEQRIHGLEYAIIEVCKAVQLHSHLTDQNFMTMENNFNNLMSFVLQPRVSITGEPKEKN